MTPGFRPDLLLGHRPAEGSEHRMAQGTMAGIVEPDDALHRRPFDRDGAVVVPVQDPAVARCCFLHTCQKLILLRRCPSGLPKHAVHLMAGKPEHGGQGPAIGRLARSAGTNDVDAPGGPQCGDSFGHVIIFTAHGPAGRHPRKCCGDFTLRFATCCNPPD
jgi:hypothetical protein